MAKVGGLQASVMPIMRIATPFFMLKFLLDLSRIIREKSKLNYRNEQIEFLKKTRGQFRVMMAAIDEMNISQEVRHEIMVLKKEVSEAIKTA